MNFENLRKNTIVLTGFQFTERNPLGYFEFDNINEKNDIFRKKLSGKEAKGKIVVKSDGFKPLKDANGSNMSNEDVFVVTRAKSRPVLIFQDIDFSKKHHDNVFVIPIQTLKAPDESKFASREKYLEKLARYNNTIARSEEEYNVYYIPKKIPNGEVWHRILILSDARFINKSLLYGTIIENGLTSDEITEIGIRLSKMLNIEELEKCSECKFNYENYININQKQLESAVGQAEESLEETASVKNREEETEV